MLGWLEDRAEKRSELKGHDLDMWICVQGSKSRESRTHCVTCGARVHVKIAQPHPFIEGETFVITCRPLAVDPPTIIKTNRLLPAGRSL